MLVYDGDCGFCTRSADWIRRRLPGDVAVVPWQSLDELGALGLSLDDVTTAAWWIDPPAAPRGGHLAIGASLVAAGGAWRLIGRGLLAPPLRWIAAPIYRRIARDRHRLPGGTDACRIDQRP